MTISDFCFGLSDENQNKIAAICDEVFQPDSPCHSYGEYVMKRYILNPEPIHAPKGYTSYYERKKRK